MDSLQEEFDRILDKNERRINLLNAEIGGSKRAQSSASYFDLGEVVRQNTEKKSKNRSTQRDLMKQMATEIDMGQVSNTNTLRTHGRNNASSYP